MGAGVTSGERQSAARYHVLDGLRGIAACLVACLHFGSQLSSTDASLFVRSGYLAVDLFFVLSGFVMDRSYASRLSGGMSLGRFAEGRIIRLYPLYVLGQLFGVLRQLGGAVIHDVRTLSSAKLIAVTVAGLCFLPAPFAGKLYPLNSPSWSLLMEIIANFVFATLLFRMSVTVLIIGAIAALSCLSLVVWQDGALSPLGIDWAYAGGGLLRCFASFTTGMVISRVTTRQPRYTRWAMLLFPPVVMALMLGPVKGPMLVPYSLFFICIIAPLIVWAGAFIDVSGRSAKVCAFLGDISYPIYMTHGIFVLPEVAIFNRLGMNYISAHIVFLATVISAGVVASRYYDIPIRRRWSRLVAIRTSSPSQIL